MAGLIQPILTIVGTIESMLSLDRQNQWRERYQLENPAWRPATEVFAERVRSFLRPEVRLLDIGCGRGGLIEQLSHPLAQIVGIDPDLNSLREHRLVALPRIAALGDRLPLIKSSFDIVTASWLLEHVNAPLDTFAAVSRVLRPAGVFIFITPNARHPLAWANRTAGRLGRAQGRLVDHLYGRAENDTFRPVYLANTPRIIAGLAARAGLVLESVEFVADPSYLAFNKAMFRAMSIFDSQLPADRRIHIVGVTRKPGEG